MKSIAVILSGCGVFDGSEIHESVLTMLALSQQGANVRFFAPDEDQTSVVDHYSATEKQEKRNQLVESARISRGHIAALSSANAVEFDGVIIPGGFGVAKNLCDFATKGANCNVNADLAHFLRQMHALQKPLGLMCISPVILPKVISGSIKLTIGNDPETIAIIEQMGAIHHCCAVDEVIVDDENKIVTTPAYMLAQTVAQAHNGISKLVKTVLALA